MLARGHRILLHGTANTNQSKYLHVLSRPRELQTHDHDVRVGRQDFLGFGPRRALLQSVTHAFKLNAYILLLRTLAHCNSNAWRLGYGIGNTGTMATDVKEAAILMQACVALTVAIPQILQVGHLCILQGHRQ